MPSAFTRPTGEAHWEVLLRARAIETQCFVVAAAQAGRHNEKRESYGHALIIDPWGAVIGRLADPLATGIAVADLNFGEQRAIRAKMPVAAHRLRGLPPIAAAEAAAATAMAAAAGDAAAAAAKAAEAAAAAARAAAEAAAAAARSAAPIHCSPSR